MIDGMFMCEIFLDFDLKCYFCIMFDEVYE